MFLIACAVLNVLFLICATRINVVFFVIFLGATLGFILAASARWCIAEGHVALAGRLVVVSTTLLHFHQQACDTNDNGNQGTGASWFSISVLGWYLLLIQLLSTMNIPLYLPVGDLTHAWDKKAKSNRGEA
jgi:uncharacterized protein